MGGIHDVWLLPCMAEFLASILIILSGIPLMNIKNKLSFLLQVPEKLKHWICEFCFRRSRHLVYLTPACGKTVVKGRNQTILLGLRLTTTLQPDLINVPASPNPYFQHPAHQSSSNACVHPHLLAFSNIQCSAIQDKTAAARSDRFQCNWSRAWNCWMLLLIPTGVLPALEKIQNHCCGNVKSIMRRQSVRCLFTVHQVLHLILLFKHRDPPIYWYRMLHQHFIFISAVMKS